MNDDEDTITMSIMELRASLLLAATHAAIFVIQFTGPDEVSGRKEIEANIEDIINIAKERQKIKET